MTCFLILAIWNIKYEKYHKVNLQYQIFEPVTTCIFNFFICISSTRSLIFDIIFPSAVSLRCNGKYVLHGTEDPSEIWFKRFVVWTIIRQDRNWRKYNTKRFGSELLLLLGAVLAGVFIKVSCSYNEFSFASGFLIHSWKNIIERGQFSVSQRICSWLLSKDTQVQ